MQYPLGSFNRTFKEQDVRLGLENIVFKLKNTQLITLKTSDKLVSEYLGISC